jgi:hypothetical protein
MDMTSAASAAPIAAQPGRRDPLPRHRYPAWLVAAGLSIIVATTYSATLLPSYLNAFCAIRIAEAAHARGDRSLAESKLLEALRIVPSSKSARIELAVVLFENPATDVQRRGLGYLQGITLDKAEWRRIDAVLPSEFRDYFQTVRE